MSYGEVNDGPRPAATGRCGPASSASLGGARRVGFALLVVGIDGSIVNIALPTLVHELHASSSQLQWIVDAYTIVFAGFLLIAGNTGDRLGRRRFFILGLVIFGRRVVGVLAG